MGYYRSAQAVVTLFFYEPPQKAHFDSVATPKAFGGAHALAAASAATAQRIYQMALYQEIRSPAVAGLKSRFVKSRPLIARGQLQPTFLSSPHERWNSYCGFHPPLAREERTRKHWLG